MPDGESERILAGCPDCGSFYTAKRWSDGTIQLIGMSNGCHCGSLEPQVVGDSAETVSGEEDIT
jgi:hypothetical protein